MADEKKNITDGKILIVNAQPLHSKHLLDYLYKRQIPVSIAERFCEEIEFSIYNKKQSAIGFKNNRGGYELRNEDFKGSRSPKYVTTVNTNSNHISVFERFFNFLSWQVLLSEKKEELLQDLTKIQTDFVILNSFSFFERIQKEMETYTRVNLFLDRDSSGIKATKKAVLSDFKFKDQAHYIEDLRI